NVHRRRLRTSNRIGIVRLNAELCSVIMTAYHKTPLRGIRAEHRIPRVLCVLRVPISPVIVIEVPPIRSPLGIPIRIPARPPAPALDEGVVMIALMGPRRHVVEMMPARVHGRRGQKRHRRSSTGPPRSSRGLDLT